MDERFPTLAEAEYAHILRALEFTGGDKTRAARILGIGRKTIYRKLEEMENPNRESKPARRRKVRSSRAPRDVEFDVF